MESFMHAMAIDDPDGINQGAYCGFAWVDSFASLL